MTRVVVSLVDHRAAKALALRRRITRIVDDLCADRISEEEYAARCEAVWDEAERRHLTAALQDNWTDVSQ